MSFQRSTGSWQAIIAGLMLLLSSIGPFAQELPAPASRKVDYQNDIQPIFAGHCYGCHGEQKQKNGYRLDIKSIALTGGEHHAPNIIPGKSQESHLIQFVAGLDKEIVMPAKGERLNPDEIGLLRAWIDQGAVWPEQANSKIDNRSDWWSLKPLRRPAVPAVHNPGLRNPIDSFIREKLQKQGLRPSPEADRRTLIRRLYFDLLGLPPTPEAIERFLADKNPRAYEKLVDQLLESPHYGERWARHWLDVVHYGETHGYDKDKPRPNAWPYRDYVIRAFDEDRPYDRFVQEQLAGDVLFPGTRDGIEALGFIASGPWDFIGHEEVPETKIDGKIARHLDRDDMVANTMQTFNSLTVQCAQCHNHKFDPITQEDYYGLQAVFAAVDRTDKKYDKDPVVASIRGSLQSRQAALLARRKEFNGRIMARAGASLVDVDRRIATLEKATNRIAAFGYHSNIEKADDVPKWVQVDLGHSIPIGSIVLYPCEDDFNKIGKGFGFPVRFKVEASDDPAFKENVAMLKDQSQNDFPNPKLRPESVDGNGRSTRYVRITATKLAPRQNDYIFALAELAVFTADGKNAAFGGSVTALDSIEAPVRWQKQNLTDGWYPGANLAGNPDLAGLRRERAELIARSTLESEKQAMAELEGDLKEIETSITKLPPQSTAFVAAIHNGAGSFRGTGPDGGKPRPIFVLSRGNVQKPGKEVGPGALGCIETLTARFELPATGGEGQRRAALAQWLTDARNPLTWRSIVNRVWQYHFGRGLVETPNDFGHMGAAPTHPELLDWLAVEFRDGGQSLKSLHKLIVCSATYRQSSRSLEAFQKIDADNRYLWRMNRRKLEAEEIRDTILFVAGKLDFKMGGPSFQDFVIDKPEHSPHYEYHLSDPEDPRTHRRCIYRFIVRSQQQPFMTALDCADPSMQVGRRNEGVSPLQALALMNNALIVTMSSHFAAALEHSPAGLRGRVRRAYYQAVGEPPSSADEQKLVAYAEEFGLPNLCRVLFNLNEFSFVD
jgi:mono/diheme cytochrome c family protein